MDRPVVSRRNTTFVVIGALLLALTWFVSNPVSADAEATQRAAISVGSYEIVERSDGLTVVVAIDPGSTGASAVSGQLSYDETELGFISCTAVELGTCQNVGGAVQFAALAVAGWSSTTELLSIEFDSVNLAVGSDLVLNIDEFYDAAVVAIDDFAVIDGAVVLAAPVFEDPESDLDLPIEPADQLDEIVPPVTGGFGAISGTVTSLETGSPVFGVEVCASEPIISKPTCGFTRTDGSYVLSDLTTGNYNVIASDPTGRFGEASPQFLGVVSPETRSDIDLSMPAR